VSTVTDGTMGTSPLILTLHMEPRKRALYTYTIVAEQHSTELRTI
jgi:hypothetical protein